MGTPARRVGTPFSLSKIEQTCGGKKRPLLAARQVGRRLKPAHVAPRFPDARAGRSKRSGGRGGVRSTEGGRHISPPGSRVKGSHDPAGEEHGRNRHV